MRIICFGPGPKFKGGIANYNTSLARALDKAGHETYIVSWTQQYPAIIPRDFIDRKSKFDQLSGTRVQVHYLTNYNNPFSWGSTIDAIIALQPDAVIFQWAIAVQGLPLSRIAEGLRKRGITVIFDLHFVIQKEQSAIDRRLTTLALRHADMYVTHALKTYDELKELYPGKKLQLATNDLAPGEIPVINLFHPVYDMFSFNRDFDTDTFKTEHHLKRYVFLFFGFIRKYKGLHDVIRAFRLLRDQRDDVSLLICGESFWNTIDKTKLSSKVKSFVFGMAKKALLRQSDNEQEYNPLTLIDELELQDDVVVFNEFIPNEDVHKYFQVSDAVLLFYEYATPSGVESIGYNFRMPLLATAVGHFPETVKPGYNGYLAQPGDIASMAAIMQQFILQPIDRANVAATSAHMSWANYAKSIVEAIAKFRSVKT